MTAVLERRTAGPATRATFRWAWRLSRREWRQQLLILAMLTVAVAATILGAGVATNTPPPHPNAATFGTASALVTLPGSDEADVAQTWPERIEAYTETLRGVSYFYDAETHRRLFALPLYLRRELAKGGDVFA